MARAYLKAGRRWLRIGVVTVALMGTIPTANAAMAVFDSQAVKQAIEQLKALKEEIKNQLEMINIFGEVRKLTDEIKGVVNDISGFANDISKSIGEIATISISVPRLDKLGKQTASDLSCLIPDGAKWGIKFEDMNFGSICDNAAKYKSALFFDPKANTTLTFAQQTAARQQAQSNRTALLEDTVSRSLAMSDVEMKTADDANSTADDLQGALKAAKTVQDRLHVVGQIEIAQLRATTRQNRIMAQTMRLQAAIAAKTLPPDKGKEFEDGN